LAGLHDISITFYRYELPSVLAETRYVAITICASIYRWQQSVCAYITLSRKVRELLKSGRTRIDFCSTFCAGFRVSCTHATHFL